jgi:hypothetical protein
MPCFGSHFQNGRYLENCRIAPLMVTYHYVKFYVSIIIYLEIININVRNYFLKMAAKTWHKKWAEKIRHCPISSKFDMWVDNDVPK